MSRAAKKSAVRARKNAAGQPASQNRISQTREKSRRAKRPKEPLKSAEPISQVTIKMRESLHRELARKAFNSGMTMRGYILRALKQAGLGVTETDLVDGRKGGRAQRSVR